MSRPSIAQRRLEEIESDHNALIAKLLAAIYDALSRTTNHKLELESPKVGKYTADMNGVYQDEKFMAWDTIPASPLLVIYSQIVKNMST